MRGSPRTTHICISVLVRIDIQRKQQNRQFGVLRIFPTCSLLGSLRGSLLPPYWPPSSSMVADDEEGSEANKVFLEVFANARQAAAAAAKSAKVQWRGGMFDCNSPASLSSKLTSSSMGLSWLRWPSDAWVVWWGDRLHMEIHRLESR